MPGNPARSCPGARPLPLPANRCKGCGWAQARGWPLNCDVLPLNRYRSSVHGYVHAKTALTEPVRPEVRQQPGDTGLWRLCRTPSRTLTCGPGFRRAGRTLSIDLRIRSSHARCVPDEAVNQANSRLLADTFAYPLTCPRTGPGPPAYVLLSSRSRGQILRSLRTLVLLSGSDAAASGAFACLGCDRLAAATGLMVAACFR
jgi:hypothetical protein